MANVTYKSQPAIAAARGAIPLAGTSRIYRVSRVLWPKAVETFLQTLFIGRTLHVCCGKSLLGDVRLDADPANAPDILCDAANMRIAVPDASFDTVLCDPPYNGKMQWNHDLLQELIRVASCRVIFQHWFLPACKDGGYKKAQDTWKLSACYLWQPRTYFGRVQVVSVFDHVAPSRLCRIANGRLVRVALKKLYKGGHAVASQETEEGNAEQVEGAGNKNGVETHAGLD